MFSLVFDGCSLAFVRVADPVPLHLALRGAPASFDAAVARPAERGIAFGDDPEDAANSATDDPLGGPDRVYFRDPDGHFHEPVIKPAPN